MSGMPAGGMLRLGFVGRVGAIVAAALVAIQFAAMLGAEAQRPGPADEPSERPIAAQVAALVALAERLPAADRPTLARAAAGETIAFTADAPPHPSPEARLPRFEAAIAAALAAEGLAGRDVSVGYATVRPDSGWRAFAPLPEPHVAVTVGLADGERMRVEIGDRLIVRVFGLPVGFLAGLIGILAAVLAVVAVAREARPLARLAREVDAFSIGLEPAPIREAGARELRHLIRAVNAMQTRIGTLLKSRTLVLGAVSHDLRTYLTRLRLRVEMLPEGPARTRAIGDVEAMQAIVEDALVFVRGAADGVDMGPSDLAAVAAACVADRRAQGEPVVLSGGPEPLPVAIAGPALRRVVENLVDNAVRYGGRADVAVGRDGAGRIVLAVEDRGPGIPVEERQRVFEPFFRREASRSRDHGGSGLGLAIVRQILDAHRAAIALDDRPGGGLSVRVELPAAGP